MTDYLAIPPAREMAGLYSIIEGATGHRDAPIWPSLGKSREAFTAMLVAANAYYLSLATASAEDARGCGWCLGRHRASWARYCRTW